MEMIANEMGGTLREGERKEEEEEGGGKKGKRGFGGRRDRFHHFVDVGWLASAGTKERSRDRNARDVVTVVAGGGGAFRSSNSSGSRWELESKEEKEEEEQNRVYWKARHHNWLLEMVCCWTWELGGEAGNRLGCGATSTSASVGRSPDYTVTGDKPNGSSSNDKMTVMENYSPAGLKVLVVDDDPVCLMILETMLKQCNYLVTSCSRASKALALLRENRSNFDVVLSDVYMPDMDGFKLLEAIGLELDLPVIMMSANGETEVVLKGITHGACDYLLKPVRIEELRNIWQHVVRRRGRGEMVKDDHSSEWGDDGSRALDSSNDGEHNSRKRKEKQEPLDEPLEDVNSLKKARVVWSVELHQQFVNAVNQLGIDKAVPKRILEIMSVQGLSRENVASHLQKYRQYMKRLSGVNAAGHLDAQPAPLSDLRAKFPFWLQKYRQYLKRLSGVNTQPYPVASFQASQGTNFGGTMQIQPGGRGVAAASCGKTMNVLSGQGGNLVGPVLGGGRGLVVDSATLTTLAQIQAHQQRHAATTLNTSHIMGSLGGQMNVGSIRPPPLSNPAAPSNNASFPGLQRMSSLELDMLMKAAQEDSFNNRHPGAMNGGDDGLVGLGRQHNSSLPPLPVPLLGGFKREEELEIPPLGLNHQVLMAEKFGVELSAPSPYSAISSTMSNRGFQEASYTSSYGDYAPVDNFLPASPSELNVSLLTQVYPHQGDDDYRRIQ
ncbi:hypothetical protein R1flu_015582 [Riccia fluitans]|uniref:Two-component response regulator n=1 Tax=Riccia fluitans TaxID=41844 RepID=A0ABD1YJE5_9MARC